MFLLIYVMAMYLDSLMTDCKYHQAIPKIDMLHNLSCLETRFKSCAVDDLLHSKIHTSAIHSFSDSIN